MTSTCCTGCNREGFGESCNRFCPCIAMYPSLCTAFLLLLLAAVVSVVCGAYSFISLRLSIFEFDWSSSWKVIVNSSLLAVISTGALVVIALSLWFVCSTAKKGFIFKGFLLLLMLTAIAALAAVMVGAIFIIYGSKNKNGSFSRELERVWISTVTDSNSTVACRIQKQLKCQGVESGDCVNGSNTANFSLCATVCRPEDEEDGASQFNTLVFPGCRERMASFFLKWNAVLLAGTSVAFILALVSFFVTCSSISFQTEK